MKSGVSYLYPKDILLKYLSPKNSCSTKKAMKLDECEEILFFLLANESQVCLGITR